jgi:hypothetical protein
MNETGRPPERPATNPITCLRCNQDGGPVTYGGEQAMCCPHCGTRTPSQLHLDRHLMRQCCGLLGRAA